MDTSPGTVYLSDISGGFRRLKDMAERAVDQVDEAHFFTALDPESNSIGTLMKHVAGNLRSRWTDFLASDGEKPWRNRDAEFEHAGETRADMLERWEAGWDLLFQSLEQLTEVDLVRTVYVRGEALSVISAINRQFSHQAYHVGQIVLLAKHFAGGSWETMSIPRGQSEAFNADVFKRRVDPGRV
jgi:hypothetical protein